MKQTTSKQSEKHSQAEQQKQNGLSAYEALVGFSNWITALEGTLPVGSSHSPTPVRKMLEMFCSTQGIEMSSTEQFPSKLNRKALPSCGVQLTVAEAKNVVQNLINQVQWVSADEVKLIEAKAELRRFLAKIEEVVE